MIKMERKANADQVTGIWERACASIRQEMSPISYSTFVSVLEPISISENTLILLAPSEVIQSSIMKFYLHILNDCVFKTTETLDQINIILPNEKDQYTNSPASDIHCNLYSKYTFQTFVVGNSNRFAHAAALAVAEHPAKEYNPLFIYGGVGLGKTHLMHAIGHQVRETNKNATVMYVTSETFTNEMIQSIASNRNREFRNRYRNVDVLLIDDIQFIARKEGVQEEFFHTFNTLHTANKQIVISSDKPPREIAALEERLRSRFEWGLIADIQPPDLETRIAILKRRAEMDKYHVPSDIMEYIAERVQSNIRELEGSLNRVIAYSQINRMDLTLPVAMEALKDMLPDYKPVKLTPEIIKDTVAEYFNQSTEAFSSKRRDQEIAYPRQIAMYLCRTLTEYSLPNIGEAFGGRNHTTVMHAVDKINQKAREDSSLSSTLEDLKKRLLGTP